MGESSLRQLTEKGHKLKGVIHVGANDGEEVPWYLENGAEFVVLFDPHPAASARARATLGDKPVAFAEVALGMENGWAEFLVPGDADDEKTSLRKPIPTEGHDWTKVPTGVTIKARVLRFDRWVEESGVDLSAFNALVVDAQGMEMEVLLGMGDHLKGFELVCVELSEKPVYENEAPAEAVVDYLTLSMGFTQESPVVAHGDVLFVRAAA